MKYAVIKTSGKQLKVQEGDLIKLDKLKGKPKDKLSFDEVLLVVDKEKITIGQPYIKGAKVSGEVIEQKKDKKIRVARFKAKSKYRKVIGHRSSITMVKITKI